MGSKVFHGWGQFERSKGNGGWGRGGINIWPACLGVMLQIVVNNNLICDDFRLYLCVCMCECAGYICIIYVYVYASLYHRN